jgi:hypothetical protein
MSAGPGVFAAKGDPTDEEVARMVAAASGVTAVKPAKPRKVLVFSISWGYKHSAISYGKKAFEILAKKTGAFEAVISDDISMFEPKNLKQFDAVVFNNTNNEIFLPENFDKLPNAEKEKAAQYDARLKASLVKYLKKGGGLAVTHAGVASFRKWPEFGNIIGARYQNHPWNAGSTVTLKVEEPDHPVAGAFRKRTFEVTDEIYQVADPYSREKLRVLVSIDADRTPTDMKSISPVRRKDKDFAITWIKSYGKGRVFYCALGHQHELFWNEMILQHYLDGVQFAAGDLKGDTTPSAKLRKVRAKK